LRLGEVGFGEVGIEREGELRVRGSRHRVTDFSGGMVCDCVGGYVWVRVDMGGE